METKMTLTEEYDNDKLVHKSRLHEDFMELTSIFIKWAKRHSDALKLKNKKQQQLDIIAANLRKRIRKKWFDENTNKLKKDKDTKPTGQELDDMVFTDDTYIEEWNNLLELEDTVNVLANCVKGIDVKRSALKYAWEMIKDGYWNPNIHEPQGIDQQKEARKLKR
jgi:hypothetical protein